MDWAKVYVKNEKDPREKLARLNYARTSDQMHLLRKLLEIDRTRKPFELRNVLEKSYVR